MPKADPLPANWRELLAEGNTDGQLCLLPIIERYAVTQVAAYISLLPLAQSPHFALRLRALIALGRLKQGGAFMPLVDMLAEERLNHWRLALLDTLLMLPNEDKISPLLPLLAVDQPGDGDACFLSGLVWFFGQQGSAAIDPLVKMLLAKPARARRLKDDLLAEAFFMAAGKDTGLLERLGEKEPPLARFCGNRIWPKTTHSCFGIYPNPDYMLQKALQAGLSHRMYKSLHHWHRNKT
ncbi:MAG: hypothetical protein FWG06_04020 [Clostridiales bacterium]|nr:hypothetical protein [Clostridiales bacterium]